MFVRLLCGLPALLLLGCATPVPVAITENAPPATDLTPAVVAAEAVATPKALSVREIAARARPSVVVITHAGREGAVDGTGSGFVISEDGLIATALHVIGEARPITVQFADGRKFEVTEIHAWERRLDLAILRIDARGLPALPLGDSDALEQGAQVVAIGSPRGLDHSVVAGVVSARRDVESLEMIQVAIPIEPGNSGGPLLDSAGRVCGVLTLKSALTENLGFAMPANHLRSLLEKPNRVAMNRWLTIGNLNPKEWMPRFGARWTQRSGRISVEGLGQGFGGRSLCLSQREVPARPYEVAVTVKLEDERGAAGLIFAADGGDLHYGFYPTGGQLRLTRFDGPTVYSWAILKNATTPHYRPGEWNTLRVRVEPERILCYVNDQLVIESTDRELTGGKVGLTKFRDTKAQFKGFQVAETIAPTMPSAELVKLLDQRLGELKPGEAPDAKLLTALQAQGPAARQALASRAERLEKDAAQLRQIAHAVQSRQIAAALRQALAQPEEKIDLFHAALLIAKLDNDDLELDAYRRQLDEMAREISARLPGTPGDAAKLQLLNRYLFEENGFHGSRSDYYNRANSYVNEVLDDREGLPLTLAVVYLELARRIGLDTLAGAPLPSHFMVLHTPKQGEAQLIDVFEGGQLISRERARLLVADADLRPASKQAIVIRMLRNLMSAARRTNESAALLRYQELIVELEPDSASDRLGRGLLRLQTDDVAGGREDLLWLLENRPRGIDLDRVEQLLRSLR